MKAKPFERLSDILSSFKQLSYTTKIFATEVDVKTYGHVQPQKLREMLLQELRFLKTHHIAFEKVWSQTFKELERVLQSSKDSELREQLYQVHEDLATIRRCLFRGELAGWSDRSLLDEWHEWERMKDFGGDTTRKDIRRERQELLRSEITLRGLEHKLKKRSPVPQVDEVNTISAPENTALAPTEAIQEEVFVDVDGAFSSWDEEYTQLVEQELLYWDRVHHEMEENGLLGEQGLPLLKKRKHAYAEKKHVQRSIGL